MELPKNLPEIKSKIEVVTDTLHRNVPLVEEKKLPPLPKFEAPKPEVVTIEENKPVFIKNEEVKVPQPPQLAKKQQPIFEEQNPSKSPLNKGELKKPEEKKKDDYDKLFGNGIV